MLGKIKAIEEIYGVILRNTGKDRRNEREPFRYVANT